MPWPSTCCCQVKYHSCLGVLGKQDQTLNLIVEVIIQALSLAMERGKGLRSKSKYWYSSLRVNVLCLGMEVATPRDRIDQVLCHCRDYFTEHLLVSLRGDGRLFLSTFNPGYGSAGVKPSARRPFHGKDGTLPRPTTPGGSIP